jgi:hypothetical protein
MVSSKIVKQRDGVIDSIRRTLSQRFSEGLSLGRTDYGTDVVDKIRYFSTGIRITYTSGNVVSIHASIITGTNGSEAEKDYARWLQRMGSPTNEELHYFLEEMVAKRSLFEIDTIMSREAYKSERIPNFFSNIHAANPESGYTPSIVADVKRNCNPNKHFGETYYQGILRPIFSLMSPQTGERMISHAKRLSKKKEESWI